MQKILNLANKPAQSCKPSPKPAHGITASATVASATMASATVTSATMASATVASLPVIDPNVVTINVNNDDEATSAIKRWIYDEGKREFHIHFRNGIKIILSAGKWDQLNMTYIYGEFDNVPGPEHKCSVARGRNSIYLSSDFDKMNVKHIRNPGDVEKILLKCFQSMSQMATFCYRQISFLLYYYFNNSPRCSGKRYEDRCGHKEEERIKNWFEKIRYIPVVLPTYSYPKEDVFQEKPMDFKPPEKLTWYCPL
jgi:hypothetical protein